MGQGLSDINERSEAILDLFSEKERAGVLDNKAAYGALSALGEYSPALSQTLSKYPEQARALFLEHGFLTKARPRDLDHELRSQADKTDDLSDIQKRLRLFRFREITRLALRDLAGLAGLDEVMETLSALGEICLRQALDFGIEMALKKFDLPPGGLGLTPIILGMGKLGAGELNYSSDVDLIYLYEPSSARPESADPATIADFVFTAVTRVMSEITEDGLVFRVDLDLRPGGKDGPHAQTLQGARRHYQFLGEPWERMALLKARPVAGDLEVGEAFLESLIPFVFRRYLDYTSLEELKVLKARIAAQRKGRLWRAGAKSRTPAAINVKLAPGGIREVEFFAQALIVTFGGRLPHLRHRATLPTLEALAAEGIISSNDAEELSRAYEFLRTVEHRLQLVEMTQTQTIPQNRTALDRLARSMNYPDRAAFAADLRDHMDRVASRFRSLLADADETADDGLETPDGDMLGKVLHLLENLDDSSLSTAILDELGFKNLNAALSTCRIIREQRYLPDSRYRQRLSALMPQFIIKASAAPRPDKALSHLERFLIRIGPMGGLLLLLDENPILLDLLSTLFGTSDYLSEILINHPVILDSLVDRRNERLIKDRTSLTADLSAALYDEEDPEDRLSIIRRFKNDEVLRVGLFDILGQLDLKQVQEQLTLVAEVVIGSVCELAKELVPGGKDLPLAVVGLGKLGGRELGYSSDLDLLFILGGSAGSKGINMETAVRVVQRFISFISIYLPEGPGYTIDPRLRPSGASGPLVVVPAAFQSYHRKSQLWERQALLKMRPVNGPVRLGRRIKSIANAAIYERPLPDDAAGQIDNLRKRMTRERARLKTGLINFKFSPGGLVDAEFITQYLQLVYGREVRGGVRSVSTIEALRALAKKGLGPRGLDELAEAHGFINGLANRLGLIHARTGDEAAYTEEEITALDPPGSGSNSLIALRQAMTAVSRCYSDVFESG